ncbi:DUF4760 domain-containing protein [Methylocapsa sp. S129]|uniref:DUF4760 domain-containing protein n=1 Tax=Methylocapsa sp. S129 TaxID=1641869 RepID=UPI00131D2717|nr:DUF4760 domain-containing protein [Methylocapsa sp. S129]
MTTDEIQFYGLCVQTGAIVVSAIGVIFSIAWNVRIARRRATLDLLINEQTHETPLSERTEFLKAKNGGDLAKWAAPGNESAKEAVAMRAVLNRYELVAIGISEGTIDEGLYKKWCRSTLVNDWISVKPFVTQLRANTRVWTVFSDFEALAKKWATKDETPHL